MRNVWWFLLGIWFLSGCSSSPSNDMPKVMPSDFQFVLQYGVMAKNEVNTINDTFTKDMVGDPPITTELVLTENEMKAVYEEMKKMKIMTSLELKPESEKEMCFSNP